MSWNKNLSSMDVDEEEDDMPTIRTADYSKMTKSFDVGTRAKSLDIDELMEEQSPESALSQLVRSWVAERGAPVVLEWQGEIVDEVMSQIEEQSKIVDSLKSDDRSTDEEHFQLILVQTEVERAKYVITSYVRARLSKIEEHAQYIVKNPSTHSNLSGIELSHARKFWRLIETHYQMSVLQGLPTAMRGLEDSHNGKSMVIEPDLDRAIFIRARRNVGQVQLPQQSIELMKGDNYLVSFRDVSYLIASGAVEIV
ncbi:GINS complex, Sld5 component [Wallemia mellicola CBS 633.66]|uniref:DNA replication complex GINS protein SLD5 n=1 Tax=Wallemia mellicola (strain ATCC MYA-4683 / CBS 633.66) TaxID=671144 RepID=I4Y7C9_WALMC|nr:GINS complex, Sld5 component [Wallemia mellicola CBS 633.66]EIM19871.1 GINS complex, Sld5 component [Wallemia mellicola CBS 633.66]|eukprot:XP_006960013.1 GINS complex, Sld5 component [Wallemia mellicola CBS 633.66]